jgi:hypothetical protein
MTTDELDPELTEPSRNLTVADALNICDRLLGEPARRRHLFAWLRAPGAPADEWLPVDGYYPGNKLVVVWHASPQTSNAVYSELVPAHGFRLLELTPQVVGADPTEAEARLRARIEKLGPAPRRAQEAQPRERRLSFAAPAAAQPAPQGRAAAPEARAATPQAQAAVAEAVPLGAGFGAVMGVVLLVVLVAEVYLGVAVVGAGHEQPLLALAFALDAGARALGTIDAGHAGLRDWAWLCALGGSPLVATFASQQRQGTVASQAAPLAGAISLMAMALAVLGGLVALASG